MAESHMRARLPALPHPDIFKDPEHTIRTIDGGALLTYDPATCSGFIYHIEHQRWSITAPIDFSAFAAMLALSGYVIADCADAQRWVRACSGPATRKMH